MAIGPQTAVRRPRTPQLEEIRAFCAAAELGGIGRAAVRLGVTQPAVSKRIKTLEELVGAALLERSSRGVRLTAPGERLYAHARRLIAEIDELSAALEEIRGTGATVRLAISHTAAEYLMPKALIMLHQHSHAPVEVLIANSRVVKEMVAAAQVDVGVAACALGEQVAGAVTIPLLDDELVVAVPVGHPWTHRGAVSSDDLMRSDIVLRDPGAHSRQLVQEVLHAHGLGDLRAASEVGSTQAAKDDARAMRLPTVMSRMALSPADMLEAVEITGLSFHRQFCILHPAGSLAAPATRLVQAFRESARPTEPMSAS